MTGLSFEALRERHPRFVYERFDRRRAGDDLELTFSFRLGPDIEFRPRTLIRGLGPRLDSVDGALLDLFVFHLGLIETLSYWKAACSPELVVAAGQLTGEQVEWFRDLLLHGMGEFFYVNRIDFRRDDLVDIRSGEPRTGGPLQAPTGERGALLLLSGGKDSAVSIEVLRRRGEGFSTLMLNPTEAALDLAAISGAESSIVVERAIDPRLLELNRQGYLNGHTPFSAYLAMLGCACAAWSGYGSVIASNERSSDEASGTFLDTGINHQYSKSSRFEARFRDYLRDHLLRGLDYYSLLRPLYELQIAQIFSGCERYFAVFRSCNRGQATNSWCGQCPKCLFVYAALFPFLEPAQLRSIFGRDLYSDLSLTPMLREMVGLGEHRPFECVGTVDETLAALQLGVARVAEHGETPPPLLRFAAEEILPRRPDANQLPARVLRSWGDDRHIPSATSAILRRTLAI